MKLPYRTNFYYAQSSQSTKFTTINPLFLGYMYCHNNNSSRPIIILIERIRISLNNFVRTNKKLKPLFNKMYYVSSII